MEGTMPIFFFQATVTLIPIQPEDIAKKESFRTISLKNIDAKLLNNMLAN